MRHQADVEWQMGEGDSGTQRSGSMGGCAGGRIYRTQCLCWMRVKGAKGWSPHAALICALSSWTDGAATHGIRQPGDTAHSVKDLGVDFRELEIQALAAHFLISFVERQGHSGQSPSTPGSQPAKKGIWPGHQKQCSSSNTNKRTATVLCWLSSLG